MRALSLTLLLAASLAAADREDRLAARNVFDFSTVADPHISADGKRIAYVRNFSDIMTDTRHSNLWMINFDGSDNRPLTSGNFNDTAPRWSPTGDRILYISNRSGQSQIYVRWMDTGQTARVTNVEEAPGGPSWSPDGTQIAFSMLVPEKPRQIGDIPPAPPGAKWAEPGKIIDRLVYRFNGVGYLKPGNRHLFVVPADGGAARQISTGNFSHGSAGNPGGDVVWTPDGKSLLFAADRVPDAEYEPRETDIYEFSIADGSVKQLTRRKGPDHAPAISPDGRQIAYAGFDEKYQGYQVTKLYVMNRDGSGVRVLSDALDRDAGNPQWAADGKGVFFTYDDQGNSKLGLYSLDGALRRLTGNLGGTGSAYPGNVAFTVARNGAFAATYTRPNVPSEIAAATVSDPALRPITAVNRGLLAQKKIGEVEEIWFNSSKDGRKIEGWIIKPPDFNPSRKYPLILEIHGGPFSNYGDRFDLEKQVWSAKDYVVLYTNPRGSTSYGAEFGNLIHHSYPGDDFYDLNSGVDAVISKGYIDPNNLFVTGGSGGGVLTCWTIGHTTRFRAAAALYPVINWYSFVLTTDIMELVEKVWFPGLPWDHAMEYEKRSLLSVVGNVKTPTMVLTGEEDFRTPMSESEQYYQALKLRKVEAVLVRVPGEPHGIQRLPSHHMEKMLYVLGWFEQHRGS